MTSGYLYVVKKNGSLGSEYTLLKDKVYNLGSDFKCHLRFPLKTFFGTACSISTNKTGAAILKKIAPCPVLLNSVDITSPQKLKCGDVLQVGHKIFKWDRLKHDSVAKSTYSSKTPGSATIKLSAKKEIRRRSLGDFRSSIKTSTKSALSTWKETNENVAASSSEFSPTKRSSKVPVSKFRNNPKLVTSKSETKPRATTKIPRMQSVTKRQLKLKINIPKRMDSNQLTPTLNTKDLLPQLKPESIKKAQSLKKSMEIGMLSKRKHSDDSFVKMAKKIKLSKDLMDESAGDHLVASETKNLDESLPIPLDSPLTISPRRSAGSASPMINFRKSLFNDVNLSGINTLMETPPRKVNSSTKSPKQELGESFKISPLKNKAAGSKSTGKKLKQPAVKSSRLSLSTRKAPRSRLISVKTKTPTQLPLVLKSVSVVKKSARKTPKAKTTPLKSASKRLSKMYKSPKSPPMKSPKKEVSFRISPKEKNSPTVWTPINASSPIKMSPRRSAQNNSFNLDPLLNDSPIKTLTDNPETSTRSARISSSVKTPAKSSTRRSSQNSSFNLNLKGSPIKTPKNSPKASSPGKVSTSARIHKINVSTKKTPKNVSPIKTSPRKSFQNNVLDLVALFEGGSATKTPKISPKSSARISISKTPKIHLSAKKTPAKLSTPVRNRQTPKNASPIKTPANFSEKSINTELATRRSSQNSSLFEDSPVKTPKDSPKLSTSPMKMSTPLRLSSRKIIKIEEQKAKQALKNTSLIKTPAKSSPDSCLKIISTPVRNSLTSKKIMKTETPKVRQTPKNVSPVKIPAKSSEKLIKTEPATRRSSQNITFNFGGLFEDSLTKTPNPKASHSVRISASPRNSFSPKKTPQIAPRIKTSPRKSKISTSSAKISSSAKKSPIEASPRRSRNYTLNLDALFANSPAESPVKTLAPASARKTPKIILSAKKTPKAYPKNSPKISTSSVKKSPIKISPKGLSPKNNPEISTSFAKNTPIKISPRRSQNYELNLSNLCDNTPLESPVKTPAPTSARKPRKIVLSATKTTLINTKVVDISPPKNYPKRTSASPQKIPSDQFSKISPIKTSKESIALASPSRAFKSADLFQTPPNKTPQQISPVLTSAGKIRKSARRNTPVQLSATKIKTMRNELLNSSLQQLFKTPTQLSTPTRTRSATKASKSPKNTAVSLEAPVENVSFSFVTSVNSPAAIQKTTRNTDSAKKSLSARASSRISKTPTLTVKSSPNMSANMLKLIAKMEKSPKKYVKSVKSSGKHQISPKNDLTDVRGVKALMRTPGRQLRSPKNDLTDVKGVKYLMKTPGKQRSPKNDLTDVKGVRALMRTPGRQLRSPKNDLTDVKGVKYLMKTPGKQRSPKNDLTDVKGVRALMRTPGRRLRSPKNDLTTVKGVKSLMKTPGRQQRSPKNDLTDVEGVAYLMKTPVKQQQKSPQNDLSDLRGVKQLMNPLRSPKSPLNDLTNITSVKNLFRTSTGNVKSPANDLTNVQGVKRLMNPFRSPKTPANDLTDIEGVKELFNSPTTEQLHARQSAGKSPVIKPLSPLKSAEKNIVTSDANNLLFDSIKGVDDNTSNFKLKKSAITYERKTKTLSPVKQLPLRSNNRKSLQYNVAVNYASIQKWVDESTPAVSQILTIKPKIEEPTALTPTTRRKARLLRGEVCTPTPEKAKPARKIVSRRKVAIATDITVVISETVQASPYRTLQQPANVETEAANLTRAKRVQFEESAPPTPEPTARPKRGRPALKKKVEKEPEMKPVRGRRAAKKEEPSPQEEMEVVEVKPVRGRRKAAKKAEEREESNQNLEIEIKVNNDDARGRGKAAKKIEEKPQQEKIEVEVEVKAVRGRRKAAKKVEDKEEPIQEERSVRGRRNVTEKQVEKKEEPSAQEETKPARKTRGRPAKNNKSDKENVAVKSPKQSELKKQEPIEEEVKTTRTRTRGKKTITDSQEEKPIKSTRATRKKTVVEESSPKPAPRTTRRKK